MPFTPAHPAIILPLLRNHYLSASGLIIGSLAPDFEYFFLMRVYGHHGHTVWGLLYFDIPVSILLAFIFHGIVKQRLIINLPEFFRGRFQNLLHFNFTQYFRQHAFVFLFSILIGSVSHIFWDAFTHRNGFFVRFFSYQYTYFPYSGLRLYNLFQHLSTFVGLSIIGRYIYHMNFRLVTLNYNASREYWVTVLAVTAGVVALRFFIRSIDFNLANFVVACISGFCIALIVTGLQKTENKKIG
jgi:hypothetical protein